MRTMFAVLTALPFSTLNQGMVSFDAPEVGTGQPQRFMPVFENWEDAEAFVEGDIDSIIHIKVGAP